MAIRTTQRKYKVKIPNALKARLAELMADDAAYGLDYLDTLATKRGKAISLHNRLTRGDLDRNNRSMLWNVASRIGQLEGIRQGLVGKDWPKRIELSDADKNAIELMNARKRYEFCKEHLKNI